MEKKKENPICEIDVGFLITPVTIIP